jgi:hypothetical protein
MVSGSKALSGGRRDCIGIRQAPRLVLPTIEVPYIARGGGRRVQSDTLPINHERQKTAAVAKKPARAAVLRRMLQSPHQANARQRAT